MKEDGRRKHPRAQTTTFIEQAGQRKLFARLVRLDQLNVGPDPAGRIDAGQQGQQFRPAAVTQQNEARFRHVAVGDRQKDQWRGAHPEHEAPAVFPNRRSR